MIAVHAYYHVDHKTRWWPEKPTSSRSIRNKPMLLPVTMTSSVPPFSWVQAWTCCSSVKHDSRSINVIVEDSTKLVFYCANIPQYRTCSAGVVVSNESYILYATVWCFVEEGCYRVTRWQSRYNIELMPPCDSPWAWCSAMSGMTWLWELTMQTIL